MIKSESALKLKDKVLQAKVQSYFVLHIEFPVFNAAADGMGLQSFVIRSE